MENSGFANDESSAARISASERDVKRSSERDIERDENDNPPACVWAPLSENDVDDKGNEGNGDSGNALGNLLF